MVWGGRRPAPCRAPRAGSYPLFLKQLAKGAAITYVGISCRFVTPGGVGAAGTPTAATARGKAGKAHGNP